MTTLNEFFDKIYYINLARRLDRLDHIEYQLNKNNVFAERVEAIDGLYSKFSSIYSVDVDKKQSTLPGDSKISSFEAGLVATHKLILIDALKNNYNSILILEDDIVFSPSFSEKFNDVALDIPPDWDIIYLGATHKGPSIKKHSSYLNIATNILGCHAIGLRSTVFEKLLAASTFNNPIDVSYEKELQNFNSFVLASPLISQKEGFFSDLRFLINPLRAFPF